MKYNNNINEERKDTKFIREAIKRGGSIFSAPEGKSAFDMWWEKLSEKTKKDIK